jgi:DNA-binding GntR family transcriptional regulator
MAWQVPREFDMAGQDEPDPAFDTFTSRLIRREALRRAALELSTATPLGLESALARISEEVTADALAAKKASETDTNFHKK